MIGPIIGGVQVISHFRFRALETLNQLNPGSDWHEVLPDTSDVLLCYITEYTDSGLGAVDMECSLTIDGSTITGKDTESTTIHYVDLDTDSDALNFGTTKTTVLDGYLYGHTMKIEMKCPIGATKTLKGRVRYMTLV